MERLPDQHGLLVQAPPRREVLHRRHPRLRRTDLQGAQDGPLGLLTLLQGQQSNTSAPSKLHRSASDLLLCTVLNVRQERRSSYAPAKTTEAPLVL